MGLEKKSFPKHKEWMVDQDYFDKLSPEEKEFMGRFNQEYYRNRFESSEKDLHNSPELKKKCYSAENARNRDLYSVKSVGKAMDSIYGDDESTIYDAADYDMGYALVEEVQERQAKSIKTKRKSK